MKLEDAKPGDVLVDKDGDVWVWAHGGMVLFVLRHSEDATWRVDAHGTCVANEKWGPFRPATPSDLEGIPVEERPVLRRPDGPIKTLFDVAEGCAVYDARNAVWMKVAADRAVRFFGRPCEFHKSAFAAADERFGPYRPAVVRHDDPVPPCAVLDGPIKTLTPTELAALGRKPLAPADPLGWEVE